MYISEYIGFLAESVSFVHLTINFEIGIRILVGHSHADDQNVYKMSGVGFREMFFHEELGSFFCET